MHHEIFSRNWGIPIIWLALTRSCYPVATSAGLIPFWWVVQKANISINVCLKEIYNIRVDTESALCRTSQLTIKTQREADAVKTSYCAYRI